MIVRATAEGLICVRQLDHAALSGALAEAWGGDAVSALAPRDPVVEAVRRHDAGWPEFDERPRIDPASGTPYTYQSQPMADKLAVAERSVSRVAAADPYAGWLVSRHFASFHEDAVEPEAIEWVTDQVGRRAELLARARPRVGREALHPHVLEANFDWLQLLDALSLAVCSDWESFESRPTAVEYGERRTTWRYARSCESGTLAVEAVVDPWPFDRPRIRAEVPARLVDGDGWDGDDAFAAAWRDAADVVVEAALAAA